MTRAALRKSQRNLFGVGAPAALAPQPARQLRHEPFVHPCEAEGCSAWGAYGFRGAWFCAEHRAIGEASL